MKKITSEMIVEKVQDEYVLGFVEKDAKGRDISDQPTVMMWVQLHHSKDETPIRISLSKNPIDHKNARDYHFEESRPEIVEAIAMCMLEAVRLARSAKK